MKTAKQWIALILALAMAANLVGCGVSGKDDTAQSQQSAVQNAVNDPTDDDRTDAGPADSDTADGVQLDDAQTAADGEGAETDADTAADSAAAGQQTAAKDQYVVVETPNATTPDTGADTVPDAPQQGDQSANTSPVAPDGEYNKGVVLVKVKESFDPAALGTLAYTSAEPLYKGSKWYTVTLTDAEQTVEAVTYLTGLAVFESVDYDYVMSTDTAGQSVDVSCNPDYGKHKHHHTHKVPDVWQDAVDNGKNPGGSADVVVAVIDTGVDYNHLDLRNNIWINTAEIAGNGKDDDGNGYVDDVRGWDFVGNDKDPMDDNGHGTHVAGIIAAENNELGGVGIAYNCKIMVLKAGNSSGYFNNSDIAEAVQYAYMNGASVINMSFGGSLISLPVEEALEGAYNSCVLVAAAGNSSLCNNTACRTCDAVGVSYPAALPYVIGVMSTNSDGTFVSSFSNYDHTPYDTVEYEVYAVGEAIPSCWPGNKYASLNGTSMAAPTVSAIAALLRSAYPDREVYSTKFLQSQIVNTGTLYPYNALTKENDDAHTVTNGYQALTRLPKPSVNLYEYSVDDSTGISAANNGNGVMDAGETVRLYFSLHNRGGVATAVNVSLDTKNDVVQSDPYFTIVNPSLTLSDIGTYSVRQSGDKYFEIQVAANCPNDYLVNFNIHFTYKNGMDANDDTLYTDDGKQKARFNVSSGYLLPATITQDTTFTADQRYIVGGDVVIPAGVTVTFEEGCEIQFYDDRDYYNSPAITVYGTLKLSGSKDKPVIVAPNERHTTFVCIVHTYGNFSIQYTNSVNLVFNHDFDGVVEVNDSRLTRSTKIVNGRHENEIYRSGSVCAATYTGLGEPVNNSGTVSITRSYLDHCATDLEYTVAYNGMFKNNFIVISKNVSNREIADLRSTEKMFADNIICVVPDASSYSNGLDMGEATNNYILTKRQATDCMMQLKFTEGSANNLFSSIYREYASQTIKNYYDASGNPIVDVYGSLSDPSLLWPHILNVEILDKDGNPTLIVGHEQITVRVTFNRPMDTTRATYLTFGTIEPYADYRIDGRWVSDTVWEGSYALKAQIENGQNFLLVNNACAATSPHMTVVGDCQLHEFTIDTTAALAMNLQAVAEPDGIRLTWNQDEYDTLLGYNIYRADEKDGNYVKMNPAVLLPTDEAFVDDNAEPGKTYWYTYTVVLSDFTESRPAGKVFCTAMDTMAPSIYHTPVNQGYENNNLVISCVASDNVAVSSATLYYRTTGAAEWKSVAMSKVNDKYSATIFGSEVTLAGLEYYIQVADGLNTVNKGDAETPYTVVVKSADSLLGKGDVDGSGSVTTKDALMLMQCLRGALLLEDDAFKRADLNGNGELSAAEALRILQYVNGKVTTLEM